MGSPLLFEHYPVSIVIGLMQEQHNRQNSFFSMICENLVLAEHLLPNKHGDQQHTAYLLAPRAR